MDTTFDAILNSLPSKKPSSRLEPYRELVTEMRKRGHSYREIAHILRQSCGLKVGASTVNDFVLAQPKSKAKRSGAIARATATKKDLKGLTRTYKATEDPKSTQRPSKALEGNARRFKDLKDQPLKASAKKTLFEYNPDEPLRLQRNQRAKE